MRAPEVGSIVPPFTAQRSPGDFFEEFSRQSVYLSDIDHRVDWDPRWRVYRHFGNEARQKTTKYLFLQIQTFVGVHPPIFF